MLGQLLCKDGKMSSGSASKKKQETQKQIPPRASEAGRDDGEYQGLDGQEMRGETSPSPVQGWPSQAHLPVLKCTEVFFFFWRFFVPFSP